MLAGFRATTARAATCIFNAPRPLRAVIDRRSRAAAARWCHSTTATFAKPSLEGIVVNKKVSIAIGDPGEAYVCIPAEIGYALQASRSLARNPSTPPNRPDRLALSYFHDTQHFALDSSPDCPRLVIPQQLPRQSTGNTSPATLYLYGVNHTIALDGTADAEFAEMASTIIPRIGGALERLKDM
ncbi:hypothetical protein PTT_12075 [Pyrenophora teres f. teres 0-1]|uniref:Uncharacterized protein n=1 Tax=Pyrenophora teres f. teres (strain 0-1) TaxID=861557 RepID=E3RSY2_PYRTT|nr:hypothetical protein PTT_12075 [Pyrenophora teres f. teres 0-1]